MNPKNRIALSFILALACIWAGAARVAAAGGAPQAQGDAIEGKVVSVHDGDTITVLDKENKQHKIRFQGIDAPESKQAFGQASKENLSNMIFGKQVRVVGSKTDRYGRTVGKVLLDGRDINIEQIKAGLAWHYKQYEKEQPPEDRLTYAAAETEARAAKRGLWQDPDPTRPSEWRAEAKAQRSGPPPPEGTIIGNKSSKNYQRPDCPGYRDTAERNRVFFKTVEEAEAAGYKRAGNCPAQVAANVTASSATNMASSPASAAQGTRVAAQASAAQSTQTSTQTPSPSPPATTGQIIGNKNSKIYHRPDCPGYKSVSEKNQVRFNSVAEAEAAGYRPAKNCPGPKPEQ